MIIRRKGGGRGRGGSRPRSGPVAGASAPRPNVPTEVFPRPAPPVLVTVSPATATLEPGGTRQFAAEVRHARDESVSWSVAGDGAIDAAGLYTAPGEAGSATVRATSAADPTVTGQAAVTVEAGGPTPLWSDDFAAGNLAPLATTAGSDPDGDATVQAGVGLTLTAPPTIGNYAEVEYQFRPSGGAGAVTAVAVGYTLAHASDALSVFLTNGDFTADAYYQTSGGNVVAGIETAGDFSGADPDPAIATDEAPHTAVLIVDDTGANPVLTVKLDGVTIGTATLATDPIGDLTTIRLRSTRGGGPGPFAPLLRSVAWYDADPGV